MNAGQRQARSGCLVCSMSRKQRLNLVGQGVAHIAVPLGLLYQESVAAGSGLDRLERRQCGGQRSRGGSGQAGRPGTLIKSLGRCFGS